MNATAANTDTVSDESRTVRESHKAPGEAAAATDHLQGFSLALVVGGLVLCLFLPALDQLILTTAMPRIVSQYNALAQISWIPNAYFMTMASFMIIYGQVLNLFPIKIVIITSVFVFELGSLLCGVAFSMNFLFFGRGVAGVGAAGLFVCIFASIAQIAPLEKRPKLMGMLGAVFGLSSVIGPLVGGALTDHATWRWCFFINLPIGGVAAAVIFFFLPNYPAPPKPANRQGWRAFLGIDYVGAILVIGANITFLYPLAEGGNTHPWKSAVIIVLFILSLLLVVLFFVWLWFRGQHAILPLHLFKSRTVVAASFTSYFVWMSMMLGAVYLTTWYQAIKGHSPTRSGVDLLPFSLVVSGFAVISGIFIGKVGRYWHILVVMPMISAIASGLEYTINEHTSKAKLVGFQILWAASVGCALQAPIIAVQAEYRDDLVDTRFATSLVTFIGFMGRMVGLGMGSALFTNKLSKYLPIYAPEAPFQLVLHNVDAVWKLPPQIRAGVIHAYALSLRYIFVLGVPAGGIATLCALLIRDHKLTPPKTPAGEVEAGPVSKEEPS